MLSHDYDYGSILETSKRVNWKLEDVIEGRTSTTAPVSPGGPGGVPDPLPDRRGEAEAQPDPGLHLLALCSAWSRNTSCRRCSTTSDGDPRRPRGAGPLHFAEEETKHIQLFKWFVHECAGGFGTPCGVIGPAADIAAGILDHSPLGVFLTTLHIEWMTQGHYLKSVKDAKEGLDPLFSSLLKHHWMEENQHAKLDTLVVDEIASALAPEEIEKGIDDYMDIGKMLDGGLQTQVELDLASLEKAIGRRLADSEKAEIREAQLKAYRWTFLLSGMTHRVPLTVGRLSPTQRARLEEVAPAFS